MVRFRLWILSFWWQTIQVAIVGTVSCHLWSRITWCCRHVNESSEMFWREIYNEAFNACFTWIFSECLICLYQPCFAIWLGPHRNHACANTRAYRLRVRRCLSEMDEIGEPSLCPTTSLGPPQSLTCSFTPSHSNIVFALSQLAPGPGPESSAADLMAEPRVPWIWNRCVVFQLATGIGFTS